MISCTSPTAWTETWELVNAEEVRKRKCLPEDVVMDLLTSYYSPAERDGSRHGIQRCSPLGLPVASTAVERMQLLQLERKII